MSVGKFRSMLSLLSYLIHHTLPTPHLYQPEQEKCTIHNTCSIHFWSTDIILPVVQKPILELDMLEVRDTLTGYLQIPPFTPISPTAASEKRRTVSNGSLGTSVYSTPSSST